MVKNSVLSVGVVQHCTMSPKNANLLGSDVLKINGQSDYMPTYEEVRLMKTHVLEIMF